MMNQMTNNFRPTVREAPVKLFLSGADGDTADLIGTQVCGWPLELNVLPVTEWIDGSELDSASCALVQVDADAPASIRRFERLVAGTQTPLIAASFEPPLALVRALLRAGAHDVVPLPLQIAELEASLASLRERVADRPQELGNAGRRKLIIFIKGEGGIGATALMSQVAIRVAQREKAAGRESCLLDLDVQFGDAAFQLGLQPALTLSDLLDVGSRLDGALLRSTTALHSSGLSVVAAPREITPLDVLSSDQSLALIDTAMREFGTVFVDLPHNWTNWSLSLLARADVIVLLTQVRIASLNRARRQLDLLQSQDLDGLDIRVVVNRAEKSMFKSINVKDAERVLGRPIAHTVVNDPDTMDAAIEHGVPVSEIRRKGPLARDLDSVTAGLLETLAVEA